FLDMNDLRVAAQVKPLNYAATWSMYHRDAKSDPGHARALSWGAYMGYESVVRWALRMKTSIPESPFFDGERYERHGDAMHVAASQGHNHIMQILLDHGGELDSWARNEWISVAPIWALKLCRAMSPLYHAIEADHEHTVKFLLDKGASLVIERPDLSKPCVPSSQQRINALHLAAKHGMYHLVRYLHRKHHIDIDLQDEWGNTALAYAMESSENLRVIQYLISEGADLDLTDDGGLSPLHRAVTLPDALEAKPVVAALIDAGANINMLSDNGEETPATLAIRFAQIPLLEVLVDAGALVTPYMFHFALDLEVHLIDVPTDEVQRLIPSCVNALLRRGIPKEAKGLLQWLLEENKADDAEVLYSCGIGLLDESPEAIHELVKFIQSRPESRFENPSLTFILSHYRDVIRGSEPEKAIAKLLAGSHVNTKGIVSLMHPIINVEWRGDRNETLLHILADKILRHTQEFDGSVLEALLDRGIDINAKAKGGLTALHIMVANSHLSICDDEIMFPLILDCMLAGGLDINAVDDKGWTALHHLANSYTVDADVHRVKDLVERGINVNARDWTASRTAFDVLLEYGEERWPGTADKFTSTVSSYQSTKTSSKPMSRTHRRRRKSTFS
ncbi:hypothetical protein ACHAPT_003791, partial [Fusarium lateritium]